jgi:hypothetical protein
MTYKERYNEIHKKWSKNKFPSVHKDGHYSLPKMPDIRTSNGLTNYLVNAINWMGGNATRVSSAGRMVDAQQKQPSGTVLTVKKYIPSTTRKGTADVTATFKGKSFKFEIKIGNDKPSNYQLEEQKREIAAGGYYFFIKTPDDFWSAIDFVLK